MRYPILSRVLLSLLLLWQLTASASAHLPLSSALHTQQSTLLESMGDESMHHEHCAQMQATEQTAANTESQPRVLPKCCQSDACQCLWLHAPAVPLTLPHVIAAQPNAQISLEPTLAMLEVGLSSLLRPPI